MLAGVLSVTIIALNEERTIGQCIESVMTASTRAIEAGLVDDVEMLLVDSRSTDRTVEIASGYPITIWQLRPGWPRSAGAGIYTGFHQSSGEYFAIVDADLVLHPDWFVSALRYLQRDAQLGGLYGQWRDVFSNSTPLTRELRDSAAQFAAEEREMENIGNGVFRRIAIEAADGHHPYLRGAEDRDISLDIRAAGYRLLQVPAMMADHYWASDTRMTLREYLRSVRVYGYGEGMAARAARDAGDLPRYRYYRQRYPMGKAVRPLRWLIAPACLLLGLLGLAFFPPPLRWWALAMVIAGGLVLLRGWRRSRSSFSEYLYLYHRIPYELVRLYGFVRGCAMPVPPKQAYPRNPLLIKRGTTVRQCRAEQQV